MRLNNQIAVNDSAQFISEEIQLPYTNIKGGCHWRHKSGRYADQFDFTGAYVPIVGCTDSQKGLVPMHSTEFKCDLPEFTGVSKAIRIRFFVTQYSAHKKGMNRFDYRYAFSSNNFNREIYCKAVGKVPVFGVDGDSNQISTGTFLCRYDTALGNNKGNYREFIFDCPGMRSFQTVYLYLWCNNYFQSNTIVDNWHVAHYPKMNPQGVQIGMSKYPFYISVISTPEI